VFSLGQVAPVRAAFALAGFEGEIVTMPVESEDERMIFVVPHDDLLRMADSVFLEQVLTQLLGRKVWVEASIDGNRTVRVTDPSDMTPSAHARVGDADVRASTV
jgi:hypothetical protein